MIAVSQRRSTVTLYVHDERHLLDSIGAVVNKAIQAVQTLEKYLSVLRQAMQELTTREFQDVVTIFDVRKAAQRTEMVVRIAREIEPYIVELGTEGRLIDLQLKELIMPVEEAKLVVRDYYRAKQGLTYEEVHARISEITQQELLLVLSSVSQALGYGPNPRAIDMYLSPRGYRVLTATHRLPNQVVEALVERFGHAAADHSRAQGRLVTVEGVGEVLAERVRVSLNLLRQQLALDDWR